MIVVASIAVTLLVLEVGYRVVLSAQGEGHSSEARRAAYEGRLEWVLRPHGPIAMGATAIDEVDEEDLVEAVQGTVLSPYIGVDRVELLTGYQELSEYFATPEAERTFDVVMLGGSVATILAADADASAALEALIAEDPRLEGRPVRLHNQARAGFKAPQTSILCDLHFQLGFRPDLVVLLDGFNEVALANENRRQGGHPLYPSVTNWSHLTPEVDLTSEDIASLAELRLAAQLAGLMAFLGHCFPVWLGFKGGKGVATFFGILFALAWPVGLACGITWIVAVAITRTSSMGALFAAALSILWVFALGEPRMFILSIVLTGLIYRRHWPNVQRLRAGTEPKIGKP